RSRNPRRWSAMCRRLAPLRQMEQAASKKMTPLAGSRSVLMLSVISVMTEIRSEKKAWSSHTEQFRDFVAHLAEFFDRRRGDLPGLLVPLGHQLEKFEHVAEPLAHVGIGFAFFLGGRGQLAEELQRRV